MAKGWTLRREHEFSEWIADGYSVDKAAALVGVTPEQGRAKWREIVLSRGTMAK